MTVTNATFCIERVLNASPARVFAAYSSLEAKSAWFKAPAEIEIHIDNLVALLEGREARAFA